MPPVFPTHQLHFAWAIWTICTRYPCSITSWWRTEAHNAALNGHVRSFHLEGLAADLVPDNPDHRKKIIDLARHLGLQVSLGQDHIHLELDYRT